MVLQSISPLKKMALSALVGVSMLVQGMCAQSAVPQEFVTFDQPFVIFKALEGSKPQMMKFNPATSDIQILQFGSYRHGKVHSAKTASGLATMVPIRSTIKNIDNNVKIDRKFTGCRETLVATTVETIFKETGLMPAKGYHGIPLVDEYVAGYPMMIVVASQAHLDSLAQYLDTCFSAKDITPTTNKPLILINVLNGADKDAASWSFLSNYFNILSAQDPNVKSFFEAAQESLYNGLDKTKEAALVGESVGERIMRAFEKQGLGGYDKENEEGDVHKLATFLALAGTAAACQELLLKPLKDVVKSVFMKEKKGEDKIVEVRDSKRNKLRRTVVPGKTTYSLNPLAVAVPVAFGAGVLGYLYAKNRVAQAERTELDAIYNAAAATTTVIVTEPAVTEPTTTESAVVSDPATETAVTQPETTVAATAS